MRPGNLLPSSEATGLAVWGEGMQKPSLPAVAEKPMKGLGSVLVLCMLSPQSGRVARRGQQ